MALFPQFPYSNLHELNLDWLIENISQLVEDGTVISVNGMSGRVTLYTEKDVELPPRAFDANWSVYRRIADKMAGIQFTGEKFFYITKNVNDEDFTIQEVFTSANPPPYPVTSVNGRIGTVIIAGDNTPYNMDGVDTIESVVSNIQKAIGPVVQYTSCSVGVTAGQYVYLFMSGISGRTDGIYKAANNKSANTAWTAADLIPVTAGIGGVLANDEASMISNNANTQIIKPATGDSVLTLVNGNETGRAGIFASVEGGNIRLAKGLAHLEMDTNDMSNDPSTGYARLYLNDGTSSEITKVFRFNQNGTFTDGNGVNTGIIPQLRNCEYLEVASDDALKTALLNLVSNNLLTAYNRIGIAIRYTQSGGSLQPNTNYAGFLTMTYGSEYFTCLVSNATGLIYLIGYSNGAWSFKSISTQ